MGIFGFLTEKRLAVKERELEKVKNELGAAEVVLGKSNAEVRSLKEQIEDLKLKKKIEEEDIKHLVKIKIEQNEIEFQRKVMEQDRVKEAEIGRVKQEYADKLQVRLELEVKNIKDMYGEVLRRLPEIKMRGQI